MVIEFNGTFNNISVIFWLAIGGNQRHTASHGQIFSYKVVWSTPHIFRDDHRRGRCKHSDHQYNPNYIHHIYIYIIYTYTEQDLSYTHRVCVVEKEVLTHRVCVVEKEVLTHRVCVVEKEVLTHRVCVVEKEVLISLLYLFVWYWSFYDIACKFPVFLIFCFVLFYFVLFFVFLLL
jgi:hypothetical protein